MNTLDKLLFNLQTLANITNGARISTAKEFIVLEDPFVLQGVWRRVNADSREKTVATISREIRTTITIAGYIIESQYINNEPDNAASASLKTERLDNLQKIKTCLIGAGHGIRILCRTYADDADFSGHLLPLLNETAACIALIDALFKSCNM